MFLCFRWRISAVHELFVCASVNNRKLEKIIWTDKWILCAAPTIRLEYTFIYSSYMQIWFCGHTRRLLLLLLLLLVLFVFFLPYFSSFASVQELNYQLFTFEASRMRQDSALRWCQFLWTQSLSLSFKRERERKRAPARINLWLFSGSLSVCFSLTSFVWLDLFAVFIHVFFSVENTVHLYNGAMLNHMLWWTEDTQKIKQNTKWYNIT